MEKSVLKFLINYNDATWNKVVFALNELESNKENLEKFESELGDIIWSYYDHTDKNFSEIVEDFDLLKAKKFLFEIWYLFEAGEVYNGKLRNQESDLIFIDQ